MKKLILLTVLTMIISIGHAQSGEFNNNNGPTGVLTPVPGEIIPYLPAPGSEMDIYVLDTDADPFIDQQGSTFYLESDYFEMTDPVSKLGSTVMQFGVDETEFKGMMAMWYLTQAREYLNARIAQNSMPGFSIADKITVDVNASASSGANYFSPNAAAEQLSFNGPQDVATDGHWIAIGLFGYYLEQNNITIPEGNGVEEAIYEYFSQSFMSEHPFGPLKVNEENPNGGVNMYSGSTMFTSIGTPDQGKIVDVKATDPYSLYDESEHDGYSWAEALVSSLFRIKQYVGPAKTDKLVYEGMTQIAVNEDDYQFEAAITLYEFALNDGGFKDYDRAVIYCIFSEKFEDKFVPFVSAPPVLLSDFHIRDSYDDIGNQPNPEYFSWHSPDVWNRKNKDFLTGHQDPEHSGNNDLNYIHVRVRKINCSDLTWEGTLFVNIAAAHTSWNFYTRWGHPDDYVWPGTDVVVGKEQFVDLSSATDYIEISPYERIYAVAYVPFDASDFDEIPAYHTISGTDGTTIHACALARIEAPNDPYYPGREFLAMNGTGDYGITNFIKYNNNVSLRNLTMIDVNGSDLNGGDDDGYHVLFVCPTVDDEDVPPTKYVPPIDITCPPHLVPQVNHTTIYIDMIPTDGIQNEQDFNNAGEIFIRMSDDFLALWNPNGEGDGATFEWIDRNEIKVKSTNFAFYNMNLAPGAIYPIAVKYKASESFRPVMFSLVQANYTGVIQGGETYAVGFDTDRGSKDGQIKGRSIFLDGTEELVVLDVMPNPVSTDININCNKVFDNIQIHDISGRVIRSIRLDELRNTTMVDVSALQKGNYHLLVLKGDEMISTAKFIKE